MIGLILIYFVGKAFYDLANEFNRNKWLYAILGVIVYYVPAPFVGVGYAIYAGDEFEETGSFGSSSQLALTLISIPLGLIACYVFYRILKNRWSKEDNNNEQDPTILDADLMNNNTNTQL